MNQPRDPFLRRLHPVRRSSTCWNATGANIQPIVEEDGEVAALLVLSRRLTAFVDAAE
jgi:hypothetical protein